MRGTASTLEPPAMGEAERIERELDDSTISAAAWGEPTAERPPAIVLAGFMTSSTRVAPMARALADERWVVAIDYPGVGRSPRPARNPTIQELARSIADFVAVLDVGPVDVVANSFGCQVATELALEQPELVDRLVLTSPTQEPTARSLPTLLHRWRREGKTQSRRYKALMVRDFARSRPSQVLATLRWSMHDRIETRLPYIDAPTLVVYGTRDPLITRRWAETVTALLPRGQLAVLPGAPHGMVFDAPLQAARVVKRFLTPRKLDTLERRLHVS
jgi:2-hydroxy-6-oxonona-2,4-dienedioate hydrolase